MAPSSQTCPFCDLQDRKEIWGSEHVVAFADGYPVSPGHALIVTRRHVPDYFGCTAAERAELWHGVDALKELLDDEMDPDGYNVGFNAGAAAGQTVMHVHLHVIPRFAGDMDDPRGGVRGVIPHKRTYGDHDAAD